MTENIQPQKPESPLLSSSFKVSSRLDPSITVNGNLIGDADLMIEGYFSGTIDLKNHRLIIGENARVEAEIHSGDISILGQVKGNIFASGKVQIGEKASMTGDITASRISILDGARFKGSVKIKS